MMNATYWKEMSMALPGQISDTSRYNVDGACVLGGNDHVLAGVAVKVSATQEPGGAKTVEPIKAAGEKPVGVAIRSHFATMDIQGDMGYMPGDGINVITVGRVWMMADGEVIPTFGAQVKIDLAGKVKTDGQITTNWTFAGGKTEWNGTKLIEVQLHQI